MYNISLKKSAEKDLDNINEPFISNVISEIEKLTNNSRNEKVKKLVDRKNEYRLTVGNYRVLFYINDTDKLITIARVLHRKDTYK